jgi:hypothetical protein
VLAQVNIAFPPSKLSLQYIRLIVSLIFSFWFFRTVVLNWIGFKPNAAAQPPRNFVKLNRDATVAGCVNATEATKFRDTHDARIIPGSGRARKARQDAAMHLELRTFGKPSDVPTPVSNIISNAYQAEWVKKASKIMETNPVKPKGALPLPVPTKASLGQAQSARKFAPTKKVFVLKRFQNIPGKMTYEDMHREFIPAAQREAQAKAAAAAAAASPAPVSP